MTAIVVDVVDGFVGHQVVVVEEQGIETQAIGQLQVVEDVPVVLQIEAQLVVLHAGSRLFLAIVTIGQTDDLRRCTVEEVLHREVAIVARTVTHILVVGHLVFVAQTAHNLVGTHIVGDVVLHVPDSVVNGVVPGEELVTQGHVVSRVARTVKNVDEGELVRVSTTDIVLLRIGSEELVREALCQTAVQVDRERVNDVLHRVHGVSESHRILRQTVISRARTTVH